MVPDEQFKYMASAKQTDILTTPRETRKLSPFGDPSGECHVGDLILKFVIIVNVFYGDVAFSMLYGITLNADTRV